MTVASLFDTRTRYKRPKSLLIIGIVFILLPFYNYYFLAGILKRPLDHVAPVLIQAGPLYTALMLAAIPVGIGLLSVQKWGWWGAILYSGTLIGYNGYILTVWPAEYNYGAVVRAVVCTAVFIYFGRKDISAPYFKVYPRGWRLQKRAPIQIDLAVDGRPLRTLDISWRGFYAEWAECPLNPGDAVGVQLRFGDEELNIDAGIVRVDERGAGAAFRGMNRALRGKIEGLIRQVEAEARLATRTAPAEA